MAMEPNLPKTDAKKVHLPVAASSTPPVKANAAVDADIDIEAELRAYEEAERERLGVKKERKQWVDTMLDPTVKKNERATLTLLTSGLTAAQDFLVEGALRGQGYNVQWIGTPDQEGLQVGKEFGNRGQCNPTYFTVGMLVKHLINLRDKQGMKTEDIIKNYVFFTAGACGPCRFGMYVTEYRKALRDAGFEGFRVMLFQQTGGLSQATGDDVGIEMNPPFFIAIVKALVCGDVINALGYRLRPYEIEPGSVNKVTEEAKKVLYRALFEKTNIFLALWQCRRMFANVKVDRLRARPKVSIIGEFWAMTTEGDGNYQLQKFLESEGGENDIQLTTAWLLYNIWEVARDTRERAELREHDTGKYGLHGIDELGVAKKLAVMRAADLGLRLLFNAFALPLGLNDYHLPDMDLIADVAKNYYSNDLRGGEGHMEVGKLIVNAVMSKAHVTVSVKPFGCMPSSGVSDGVQSLITARYPGSIYCAVETSGDGATNFYSRIQMYMFKARQMAEAELQKVYEETGVTEQQVRDFLAKHPSYASPFHKAPHVVAGTAADLVYEVAPLIEMTATQRAAKSLKAFAGKVVKTAQATPGAVAKAVATVRDDEFQDRLREDATLLRDLVAGKAKERFAPLVKRLAHRAITDRDPSDVEGVEIPASVSRGRSPVQPAAAN
jgi:predicted nucleotide-binding protein (sugar kinase/HSP70/actin superfamily)